MKTILLLTFLFAATFCRAQTPSVKTGPVPSQIYITPDLTRMQLDSAIQHLKQWKIELSFETLEYDPFINRIAIASGSVINSYYPENVSKAKFSTSEFKGLTIITSKEKCGIYVGILPAPKN